MHFLFYLRPSLTFVLHLCTYYVCNCNRRTAKIYDDDDDSASRCVLFVMLQFIQVLVLYIVCFWALCLLNRPNLYIGISQLTD